MFRKYNFIHDFLVCYGDTNVSAIMLGHALEIYATVIL